MLSVAVSYCHADGAEIAEVVVAYLRSKPDLEVCWDGDLAEINPASLPEWMDHTFEKSDIVVSVITTDYIEFFGPFKEVNEHHGVRRESRIIRQRLYADPVPDHCPVIPVAAVDMALDAAPSILGAIKVTRLRGDDPKQLAELYERIQAVNAHRTGTHRTVAPRPEGGRARDALRAAMDKLRMVRPLDKEATSLVEEWLDCAAADAGSTEFARAFDDAERIIKANGDDALMARVVDACCTSLAGSADRVDVQMLARVLIHGRAWHLRRADRVEEAAACVTQAIGFARSCKDHHMVARGYRCLARIYRRQAEINRQGNAAHFLRMADKHACDALKQFRSFKEKDPVEVAVAIYVLARVKYARYELLAERRALRKAARLIADDEGDFPPDRIRHRVALEVLRCQVLTARRRLVDAEKAVGRAMALFEQTGGEGASYTGLLARAHRAQARLFLERGTGDIRRHTDLARDAYSGLGLVPDAAECDWLDFRMTADTLRRAEITLLERKVYDPRQRLSNAERFVERIERGTLRMPCRRHRALIRIIASN